MKECVWCEDSITGGMVTVRTKCDEHPFHVKCYREYKGNFDGVPVVILTGGVA